MKSRPCLLAVVSILGFSASLLSAGTLSVSVQPFSEATLFSFGQGSNLDLRVAELVSSPGSAQATHILIEQLVPVADTAGAVYSSPYHAVEISTGTVHDVGQLYLQLPSEPALPEGSVASPIVGIVERAGAWANFGLQQPDSSFGGAAGTGSFAASGTLQLNLLRAGVTYTGSANYTVRDFDTLSLHAFTLSGGGNVLNFSAAELLRDGMNFHGTVANLDPSADYNSLFFQISLTGIPDVDGDGIPDLVDPDVGPAPGMTPGTWNSTYLGWVWAISPDWGFALHMGWVYLGANAPYVYQAHFGWFVIAYTATKTSPNQTAFYMYNQDIGWVYLIDTNGGFFQNLVSTDPMIWEWNSFISPNSAG